MSSINRIPTQDYLAACFTYSEEQQGLIWKTRPASHFKDAHRQRWWNARFAKRVAGSVHPRGYIHVYLDGKPYKAHRLVWKLLTGEEPSNCIDHKNGIKCDNRFSNLRCVTQAANTRNSRLRRDNKTGVHGVYQRGTKFIASFQWLGVRYTTPQQDTLQDAARLMEDMKQKAGAVFSNRHGK